MELSQVAFWEGQEAEDEFKLTCEPLKHRFLDFTQVKFWACQEAENDFRKQFEHLNRRFID